MDLEIKIFTPLNYMEHRHRKGMFFQHNQILSIGPVQVRQDLNFKFDTFNTYHKCVVNLYTLSNLDSVKF